MGAACCVAAKDRTIINRSNSDVLQRNAICSPSWSVRWDHRGRVAGEETSVDRLADGVNRNDRLEIKSGRRVVGTAHGSVEESQLEQTLIGQKSPVSERNAGIFRVPSSDLSSSRNVPTEVKELPESLAVPNPSPLKMSPSLLSVSSLSTSPLSSQSPLLHTSSTPSRWAHPSPARHLLRQASDSRIQGRKRSDNSISEETSFPAFPEFMEASHRGERWSFDSESLGFYHEKLTPSSSRSSASPSDTQTCGVCSKLVAERSSWHSYELAVVSVLTCGHVYHSDCLENITAEINKYDPACPVCTFGEKRTPMKLSEKALKVVTDLKGRKKRSRNRVVSSDLDGDSVVLDGQKSLKSSTNKPFLRRHFSFGSKGTRSLSENHSTWKQGFFWSKSRKE
ncbi:hypothetical protein RHMOL_Rhmol05G0082300 [Rhododendron molle]|uniref:Uncharacterized protein n=2 Tax=Rhododendron molle TaxID=49168 RepID=A0ACC0NNT1_RHOML|nr:hypothetical protein RHMOL_Rhmol05G0082300 [Rhododendron molle]KAI8554233.1 hypothetical protein RHMOL_Rhmol05G0082300 [Rhododendron molle]